MELEEEKRIYRGERKEQGERIERREKTKGCTEKAEERKGKGWENTELENEVKKRGGEIKRMKE